MTTGPSLHIRNLQVDVPAEQHDATVTWWAEALGGTPSEVDGPYTKLDGIRSRVGVHVRQVDDGSTSRLHLDLEAGDVRDEVPRLIALGATVLEGRSGHDGVTVLSDPAGLAFCVVPGAGPDELLSDERELAHLRVIVLDVPEAVADAEASFWAAAFGGEATPVGEDHPEYTFIDGVQGPGGPLNVMVQTLQEGPARLHVDLHCASEDIRDQEVDRLTVAGAGFVAQTTHWRVLTDPAGNHLCVVPDETDDA